MEGSTPVTGFLIRCTRVRVCVCVLICVKCELNNNNNEKKGIVTFHAKLKLWNNNKRK